MSKDAPCSVAIASDSPYSEMLFVTQLSGDASPRKLVLYSNQLGRILKNYRYSSQQ